MKFGDIVEEFIFLVFKYHRRDKGIDYFQSAEESEGTEAEKSQDPKESLGDMVQLQKSPKQAAKRDKANIDHKYEMCTVPEESNEDELEDSPTTRRMLSPGQFFAERKGNRIDPITLSPLGMEQIDMKPVSAPLINNSEKTVFTSPLMLPKTKNFRKNSSPDLGATTEQSVGNTVPIGNDKRLVNSAVDVPTQHAPDDEVKIEGLNDTPASKEGSQTAQRKDSKVKIIEKLESKIFKLLREAKRQISRSKDKIKSQSKEKKRKVITPFRSRERVSREAYQKTHMSVEVVTTPKKSESYRLPKPTTNRTSVPCARNAGTKRVSNRLYGRDNGTNSFFSSEGDIHKHTTSRRTGDLQESKKISLSFNLEFTKFLTTGKSRSKERPVLINTDRGSFTDRYTVTLNKPRLTKRLRKSHNSPRNQDLSESKDGSMRGSSKYSFDTPTRQKFPIRLGERSNGKLGHLLDKIKHGYTSTTSKDQSIAKEKLFKQRSSEGTVNHIVKSKLSNQVKVTKPKPVNLKGDIFMKRREGGKLDSSLNLSHHKTIQNLSARNSGLASLKNKLKQSLLNHHS